VLANRMNAKYAYIFFITIIVGDVLTSIGSAYDWPYWNFGILIKTPLELFLLFYSLKFIKTPLIVPIVAIGMLFLIWLTNMTLYFGFPTVLFAKFIKDDTLEGTFTFVGLLTVFSRYIFFFLLSLLMYLYASDDWFVFKIKRLFEYFIIINSICIIAGAMFNISLFSSYNPNNKYDVDLRFGYKGLLIGINEVTGVYFLAISHFYREILVYKRNIKIPFLLLVMAAAVLTGTKASALAVLLITGYYLYKYFRKTFFLFFLPSVSIALFLLLTTYFYLITAFLSTITQNDSLMFAITGGRSYRIDLFFTYIKNNWYFPSYLLGQPSLYTETDMLDLYFFFGIGCLLYLLVYARIFLKFEKTSDKVPLFILMLFVASLCGHIIQSAVVPIFLIMYLISSKNTYSTKVVIS
jgi:hypothetical protein